MFRFNNNYHRWIAKSKHELLWLLRNFNHNFFGMVWHHEAPTRDSLYQECVCYTIGFIHRSRCNTIPSIRLTRVSHCQIKCNIFSVIFCYALTNDNKVTKHVINWRQSWVKNNKKSFNIFCVGGVDWTSPSIPSDLTFHLRVAVSVIACKDLLNPWYHELYVLFLVSLVGKWQRWLNVGLRIRKNGFESRFSHLATTRNNQYG